MPIDWFMLLAIPILIGIAALSLRKGLATGTIQYGRSFGRPLTIDRAARPTAFRAVVALHVFIIAAAVVALLALLLLR